MTISITSNNKNSNCNENNKIMDEEKSEIRKLNVNNVSHNVNGRKKGTHLSLSIPFSGINQKM